MLSYQLFQATFTLVKDESSSSSSWMNAFIHGGINNHIKTQTYITKKKAEFLQTMF